MYSTLIFWFQTIYMWKTKLIQLTDCFDAFEKVITAFKNISI